MNCGLNIQNPKVDTMHMDYGRWRKGGKGRQWKSIKSLQVYSCNICTRFVLKLLQLSIHNLQSMHANIIQITFIRAYNIEWLDRTQMAEKRLELWKILSEFTACRKIFYEVSRRVETSPGNLEWFRGYKKSNEWKIELTYWDTGSKRMTRRNCFIFNQAWSFCKYGQNFSWLSTLSVFP